MNIDKFKRYSPIVLRTGLAIVFLWFAFSQIKDPTGWARMIPSYATAMIPISANVLVYMNACFEIIFASLLLLGLFTRTVSLLLALHLFHITTILGYGPIAARDFSLALATLAVFLNGADEFCLDKIIKKNPKENISN
jgi:uncharacterized membrane protein YphA (DoxX/SURF4 family)